MKKLVDINNWERREIYEHFSKLDNPFYSITLDLNVTNIKRYANLNNYSFNNVMVWVCTKSVNAVPAFNMRIINNKLYQLDQSHPTFTTMDKDSEIFKIIRIQWVSCCGEFDSKAKSTNLNQHSLFDDAPLTNDKIFMSSIPWLQFTSATNVKHNDSSNTTPRLIWDQYREVGDELFLHLSIEVNHRTVDGFHIAKFKTVIDHEISLLT